MNPVNPVEHYCSPSPASPPLAAIEAALRKTTEFLALQLVTPVASAPHWSDFEWQIAQAASALQGISPLLASSLPWPGPRPWEDFLREQRHHSELRHGRICNLLSAIDRASRAAGMGVVALKGAALLRMDTYRTGDRPMGDIDLLVREQDVEAVAAVLGELGYRRGFAMWRHVTFEPAGTGEFVGFGEHIDNPIRIEVHTRIAERLPLTATDITALVLPASLQAGVNPYPSLAALMHHLLLHAAGNMRARALRHVQLFDLYLLSLRLREDDWRVLLDSPPGERASWWMLPPLLLTTHYHPALVPAFVLTTLASQCPRHLRHASERYRLSDVSWSNIRIPAFPGIEWSRSPAEAVRFALSRVLPSRSDLAALKYAVATPSSGAHIPWYGQSHLTRVARWLFGAPPRVQTMFAVRSALGDEPPGQLADR